MDGILLNILKNVLENYGDREITDEIFKEFKNFFKKNQGNVFFLNRHTDPGMKNKTYIRISEAYSRHVVVDVLNAQKKVVYKTSISYAPLLDCDNVSQKSVYEILNIFSDVSIVKD